MRNCPLNMENYDRHCVSSPTIKNHKINERKRKSFCKAEYCFITNILILLFSTKFKLIPKVLGKNTEQKYKNYRKS
jgi:hypothetical protein